jgi:thiol:disulfide interchange protein/DsbC/DsbD-like thiol-disulfide interchange protein
MNRLAVWLSMFVLTLCIVPPSGQAQVVRTDYMDTELIAEMTSMQPGQPFWVALRMKMDEHWHTYWRNPGDSGLPTEIEWTLPEGFKAGEIQWPYPQKIVLEMLATYGHEGEIFLMTEITPPATLSIHQQIDIHAYATWLVCDEICLPGESNYTITLPVKNESSEADKKWTDAFAEAREKLPVAIDEWKIAFSLTDSTVLLHATPPVWFTGSLSEVAFYPFEESLIDYVSPQQLHHTAEGYLLTMERSIYMPSSPEKVEGVLMSGDGWRGEGSEKAMVIMAARDESLPAPIAAAIKIDGEMTSIWLALAFAFIGGLILNLMPCVLPVLSIKILGFVHQARDTNSKSWQHGLMFTGGVLLSFLSLAGALIAFRAGGEQLGWGFQLQSPLFLVIVSSFIFLFGLSLFGLFEIGTSMAGIGGKVGNKSGLGGSFLTGIMATLVATPCTAPFMGPALGFALTQSDGQSLLIFAFLGLGMAAPYMILASVPSLLKFVPKPGAWMESLKQFMGFMMMATVVWLVWVLSLQTDPNLVAIVLCLFVLLGLGGWIFGRWGGIAASNRSRLIARACAVIIMAGSLTVTLSIMPASSSQLARVSSDSSGLEWEPFSQQRVDELRTAGQPVFIDFTAAWCLSCQVNKRIALHNSQVVEKFESLGVTVIKADWTSRDPAITQALARFGRNSVPLYVLYTGDPDAQPEILPEILTPGIVLEALEKVVSGTTAQR